MYLFVSCRFGMIQGWVDEWKIVHFASVTVFKLLDFKIFIIQLHQPGRSEQLMFYLLFCSKRTKIQRALTHTCSIIYINYNFQLSVHKYNYTFFCLWNDIVDVFWKFSGMRQQQQHRDVSCEEQIAIRLRDCHRFPWSVKHFDWGSPCQSTTRCQMLCCWQWLDLLGNLSSLPNKCFPTICICL